MNAIRKFGLPGALGLAAVNSYAALPTGVDTAISDAGTDGKTLAVAVLVALIGIFAVKLMRRGL